MEICEKTDENSESRCEPMKREVRGKAKLVQEGRRTINRGRQGGKVS